MIVLKYSDVACCALTIAVSEAQRRDLLCFPPKSNLIKVILLFFI